MEDFHLDAPESSPTEVAVRFAPNMKPHEPEPRRAPAQHIHQLFEAQVESSPNDHAVRGEGEQLTYRELNDRANQLAWRLRRLGVGPEVRVGVCIQRDPLMIVSLLAVHKAGGAYVPLDASYPSERLDFMLEDARISTLITTQSLAARFTRVPAQVIYLDADGGELARESKTNPGVALSPENLAYVVYTSGSTGRPKGVAVTHLSLVNHALAIASAYQLQRGECLLQFSSISFDVAAEEIFPSLVIGATVVMRGETQLDGAALLRLIKREKLAVINLPAQYWHIWLKELATAGAELPSSLRLVVTGSEKVSLEAWTAWQKPGAGVRLINAYGTSETTITSMLYEPAQAPLDTSGLSSLPIGRPIANTRVHILDDRLQPQPTGAVGELYIGGHGLARGYFNRPDLTAEVFVPDPFGAEPGARLYRTGDLVRCLPDGNVEYMERTDRQAKVRGYRIELAEVEATLAEQAGVKQAVVILREDVPGEKQLVAYVVFAEGASISVGELRNSLRERLPEYMVPSWFVQLDAFPSTLNGKLDRRALPPPARTQFVEDSDHVAPRTPTEKMLADIWSEVLRVERVGVEDNFFDVGGNSLLALLVLARVRENLKVEIKQREFFQSPTIARLAVLVEQRWLEQLGEEKIAGVLAALDGLSDKEAEAQLDGNAGVGEFALDGLADRAAELSLSRLKLFRQQLMKEVLRHLESWTQTSGTPQLRHLARGDRTYPLSFAQQRLLLLEQLHPDEHFGMPVAWRLEGALDVPALEKALKEVVRRHEVFRTRFVVREGQHVQLIEPDVELEISKDDFSDLPEDERAERVEEERQAENGRPFNLETGQMLRVRLLRVGAEAHVIVIVTHHIISDAWSIGVLTRETAVLYYAFANGVPSPLRELPIQYADYAAWEREQVESEEFRQQLSYWRPRLSGTLPVLEWPVEKFRLARRNDGKPPPRPTRPPSAEQPLTLPQELMDELNEFSRREGVTLYMLLLSAFKVLLQRYTRQEDILVATPIAGRSDVETEKLIGPFSTFLMMRTDLSGNPSFRELLHRVEETALGAFEHQAAPFEKLLEEFQPALYPDPIPPMQAVFTLLNAPTQILPAMTGMSLRLEPIFSPSVSALVDLSVSVVEAEGRYVGWIQYRKDLFEPEFIQGLEEQFRGLLNTLLADPEIRIADLPLSPH